MARMLKKPEPIAAHELRRVAGGCITTSPLGSLSLFIASNNDPSRAVAKSFDVLTLSSPVTGVARIAHDAGRGIPKLPPLPKQRRGRYAASAGDQAQPMVTVDDLDAPSRRRRRA
jgi:hypothetical protein